MSNLPTLEEIKAMSDAELVSFATEGANVTALDPFSENGIKLREVLDRARANDQTLEISSLYEFKLGADDREFLVNLVVEEEKVFNQLYDI